MQEFYKKHTKNTEKPSQEAIEQAARDAEREITDSQWADLIAECRVGYRTPLLESDRNLSRIALTKELHELLKRRDDPLLKILKDQALLHDHGDVFWGHLVEGNNLLYKSNNEHTLPAAIVYSTDPFYDDKIGHLEKISQGLIRMKGATPDDTELGAFVRVITKEFEQILRSELPRSICDGRPVYYATILVQPQHLPGNALTKSSFPVVTNFNATEAAMILPSHFWPQRLLKHWQTVD